MARPKSNEETLEAWSVRIAPSLKKKVQASAKKDKRSANAQFSLLLEKGLEAEKTK
jgi:hypothetical protein